jgi:hypothetical protein
MPAPPTPKPPKCRYCKKTIDAHGDEDHVFRTYINKTKAASNSFLKTEIDIALHVFRLAITGQPVPASYVRSKPFANTMRKFTNMQNSIKQAEHLNKIGETKYEQQKTVA